MAPEALTRTTPLQQRAPEVIRLLKEEYRGARVALEFTNPLECLVATILSAQSTDKKVNEVTQGFLFAKYRRAEDYLKVPESELAADLKPTGFFNQKTKAIRGACRMIVEEFGGKVPDHMADLIRLPGVARKTANIVLWNSSPKAKADPDAGIAVDTHVRRVSQRLGFTSQKDPNKIERDLMEVLPREDWMPISYVFIDHGRTVCKAPTPKCEECPVNHLCPSSRV